MNNLYTTIDKDLASGENRMLSWHDQPNIINKQRNRLMNMLTKICRNIDEKIIMVKYVSV